MYPNSHCTQLSTHLLSVDVLEILPPTGYSRLPCSILGNTLSLTCLEMWYSPWCERQTKRNILYPNPRYQENSGCLLRPPEGEMHSPAGKYLSTLESASRLFSAEDFDITLKLLPYFCPLYMNRICYHSDGIWFPILLVVRFGRHCRRDVSVCQCSS